ncbi:MAG: hypothetical protein U1D67_05720, partial [Dehalococcoidia bacterium]|nr:hypothetical protein [Dehalococcoidia bacterium]
VMHYFSIVLGIAFFAMALVYVALPADPVREPDVPSVQPQIESLMQQVKPEVPVPQGIAPKIKLLRSRRKKLSGVCLFLVLTALIMGLQATFFYNFYLALGFIVIAAVYAWRVYSKPVPWGWV